MAIRGTRVRRLRVRHAIERTTLLVVALAATVSIFEVQTAAGERSATVGSSAVNLQQASSPDVGVWVVDGANRFGSKMAGLLAEASASAPSVGTSSVVAARVVVAGKVHDVLTNATTTGELLSAMGITPDASDRVQPPLQTPLHPGIVITFDSERVTTKVIRVPIPFTTYTTFSRALPAGSVRVITPGADGLMVERIRVRVVDGKVVHRSVLARRVVRSAIPEHRALGSTNRVHGSQTGEASWYDAVGTGFTAASPWLPFGTRVRVKDLSTGKSVVVVINDRGPFGGRIIDLSPEAFSALAPLGQGVMQVRLTW